MNEELKLSDLDEVMECDIKNVKINPKHSVDIYVGKILELDYFDTGNLVMCVVKEFDNVKIENMRFSVDLKVQPLHVINRGIAR